MILELQQLSIVPFIITYSMSSQLGTCTFMWVNTDKDLMSQLEEQDSVGCRRQKGTEIMMQRSDYYTVSGRYDGSH
jgi:hypothetical protein